MSSNVTLEIERVVESFSAKLAFVLLVRTVIASMTIEHPHMLERFAAEIAGEICRFRLSPVLPVFLEIG